MFIQWIDRLKRKWQEPKVYAVAIRSSCGQVFIRLVVDYSVEDALKKATDEIMVEHSKVCRGQHYMSLEAWHCKKIEELKREMTIQETVTEVVALFGGKDKNQLLQKIIETKDVSLFEQSRHLLSPSEVKLVEEKLSII